MFALALLFMSILALTSPAIAALLKNIMEGIFFSTEANLARQVVIPTLLVFSIAAISSYLSRCTLAWVANRLVKDLRMEMFKRLLQLSCDDLERQPAAGLVSRFTFDVTNLKAAGTSVVTTLSRDTLSIIGLVAWMAYIDWLMTLVALLAVPFILLTLLAFRRRLRKMSRRAQHAMAELHHALSEAIAGHRIIKIFAGQEQEGERFHQKAEDGRRFDMQFSTAAAAGTPVINMISAVGVTIIVYVASVQAAADKISVAEFNSFFAAVLMLLSPLRRLSRINEDMQKGLAACESVFAFIDQAPEPDNGAVAVDRLTGAIELRDLGFTYEEGRPVLHDLSLTIQPGQSAAVIGPSGSGKTSLVNLLPRFHDNFSGQILLDGHDIRDLSLAGLRKNIAMVSQDIVLYDDTVRNNIAYGGQRGAPLERIREAARQADALDFIEALEQGFDTVIGANGTRLSGGQRQRIALARAILKDAPILVLDEATAALDTESERNIQLALDSIKRDRTCIIIAHRLSTIESADHVFVLEEGRLVQSGDHDQLQAQEGVYSRLHAQAQ